MAEPIANLIVKIGSDVAGVVSGGKQASSSLKGISDQAKKAGKAIAAMAAVGATALGALTVKQMRVIDDTAKMARNLGIATDSFQALALVADEAGVAQEKLGPLFTKSQRSLVEASRGLETYARSFRTLNLDVDELLKMAPDKQFEEIAIALSKIENPTVRTSAAMEIFGRQGLGVIGMLEQFGSKLEEAREFNDRFNISISDIDGRKVEEANDTFARLGKAVGGLGNTIAIQVAPLVTELSNRLLNAGIDGEDFGRAVSKGIEVAAGAIDIMRHALIGLDLTFNAVIMSIGDLTAKVSLHLYDLGTLLADTFNKIPGVSLEAEDGLLKVGLAAKTMADDARIGFQDALKEAENFKSAAEAVAKIQEEAQRRAEEGAANGVNAFLDPFSGLGGDEDDPKAQKAREQMEAKLEAFRESLRTEEESEIESHERRLEELASYMEMRLITEQEYNSLMEDEKERHERTLTDIKEREAQNRKRAEELERSEMMKTFSMGVGLLDQFAGESKAFAIASIALNKALSIAEAIQNTAVAVTKALAIDPTGVLAARVAAMGKVQVGIIAATGLAQASGAIKGGGGSSGYSGGVPVQNTQNQSRSDGSGRAIDVSISGVSPGDLITYETASAMLKKINEVIDDGATIRGIRFA